MTIPTLPRSSLHRGGSSSRDRRGFSSSPFHSAARAFLIATIFGAPWAFGAVQPWAWRTLMVLSSMTLVLWAVGCAQRGVLRVSWSPLYWPFLAFLLLAAVQFIAGFSLDHVATREALLKLVTNFIFFFLAGQLLNAQRENGRSLEWLGLIVTLLAFSLCVLGLAQMYWGEWHVIYWTLHVEGAPFGPYVNRNNYAGVMEMLLPISVAYILSRRPNPLLRFFLWFAVILVIISVWISGSRAATVVLLVEGLLLAGILMWHRPRGVSPRYFPVLLGVALISVVGFSWLLSTGRVGGNAWSVFETNQSLEVKLGDRLRVGLDTLRMARSHPWMGVGVGCFEYAFPSYLTFPTDLHWTHAHDDVLEGVAETGLPGTVLIVVALLLFFRVAFRHIEGRLRHGWGWIQLGAAVGTVGMLCHSLVDFNLRVPANAAWFVVCLAIATHAGPAQEIPRNIDWDAGPDRSSEFLT